MGRLVLIALPVMLLGASPARAQELALEWTAPRDCPSKDALRDGITTRLGRAPQLDANAEVAVEATVDAVSGGYTLDLRTRSAHGSERRSMRARSCTELARASILVAALLLMDSPQPDAAARHDAARRTRAPTTNTWFMYARTSLRGELGSLPTASFGPGVTLGLALSDTRFELGGTYLPPQTMYAVGRPQALGSVQLMAANAGVCQVLLRGPELAPCLHAEVGSFNARGQNLARVSSASTPWFLGALGLRLGFELWRGVSWQSEVAAGVPFQRPSIAVHGLSDLHHTPAVIGRLETGLSLTF